MASAGGMGEGLSTGALVAVPVALSPAPHNLIASCRTPVTSKTPLLHWSSRCFSQWEFGCWLFKRLYEFLAVSPLTLMNRTPSNFCDQMLCYVGFSSWHWCSTLESPAWGWETSLLRGHLCSWDIPPDSQLLYMGAGPALFTSLPFLLVSLIWLHLYVPSYKLLFN